MGAPGALCSRQFKPRCMENMPGSTVIADSSSLRPLRTIQHGAPVARKNPELEHTAVARYHRKAIRGILTATVPTLQRTGGQSFDKALLVVRNNTSSGINATT